MKQNTFSIVARDPKSGKIAVGGSSNWFAYSRLVPWIEAGLGAVATQAETSLSYPKVIFESLKSGKDIKSSLIAATLSDENKNIRQVIVIDNNGNTSVFTGEKCVKFASDYSELNFAVAGNMLANDKVIPSIIESFKTADEELPLAERMIQALKAGQDAGGDFRGKRSAGLLVSESEKIGTHMDYISTNIRIDDHVDPILEMERIYNISKAYKFMEAGDNFAYELNDKENALKSYQEAFKLQPENDEVLF
ncbi:MAG: DUF1028 domain-containing protein [Candidatus Dojkabacteria bacterium]|nr:DUF1028 domain-containing protein [Candidatus Dojkabacteria bacterium]MDQ7021042.1 DUF1028 domain-containing protein [Candidatus Dojkabacteria bacterium]